MKSRSGDAPVDRLRDGFSQLAAGQYMAAEQTARALLAAMPSSAPALNLLAIAINAQARPAEAMPMFAELTRREPLVHGHWTNLGTTLRAVRRYDEALQAYLRAAALGEQSADFKFNVGLLHLDRNDFESARTLLAEAHAAAPGDGEIAYQYASCCYEMTRTVEGLRALEQWRRWAGSDPEACARVAVMLLQLGDAQEAETALQLAIRAPDPGALALMQIVVAYERTNRLEEARAGLERLRAMPASERFRQDVQLVEAKLAQREGRHEDAVRLFASLAAACTEPERRHFHQFPLAKSLDALGRTDEAFATLVAAHESHARHTRLTAPELVRRKSGTMRITQHGCDAADVARWHDPGAPPRAQSPVFIVAYPRSGTTLLEQTLDAHPRLVSMDEQPFVQSVMDRWRRPGVEYPEQLAALTPDELESSRRQYWTLARSRAQLAPGQRLIDKNPLNVLRLPAIRRLFPHSPILLAIRHPCDVVLSCYMQHFRADFGWVCRDLETLSAAYASTFDFWYRQAEILRPDVLEVRYESFVADFPVEVRRLAGFLDLPWDDAMLSPAGRARDRGYISTPSYAQVVEPVHSRSVERWRRYERHLAPILPVLQPWLERWDYAA